MDDRMDEYRRQQTMRRLFNYQSQNLELKYLKDAIIQENYNGCNIDCQKIQNLVNIDEIIYNANRIDKIILPSYLQEFVSIQEKPDQYDKQCTIINSFVFTSYQVIHTIIIKFQQKIMLSQSNDQTTQMNYGYNRDVQQIDLSKFVSLTVLKLSKIGNDIILPNQLQELEIEGQGNICYSYDKSHKKILNFPEKLTKCKIEKFQIDEIDTSKLEKCELKNCSITNLILSNKQYENQILNENIISQITVPPQLKQLVSLQEKQNQNLQKYDIYDKCHTQVLHFFFNSCQVVHTIAILCQQKIMLFQSQHQINQQKIDLSNFVSLKILKLCKINCDIILPDQSSQNLKLEELEIYGQNYSSNNKILNFPAKLLNCKIRFFEIDRIDISQFENYEFKNCKINILILQDIKCQKQILDDNTINTLQFISDCKQVNYVKNSINRLILCNSNIQKLSFFKLNSIHVSTDKLAQHSLAEQSSSKILDLQQFNMLQIVEINTQLVQIAFPVQIQNIYIQKLLPQIQLLDFSSFDLLEILEIDEHYIEYIVLPKQNKKKVTLSFNPQIENSIYIETSATSKQNSFIDNTKILKVKGLLDVIYSKKSEQNRLDFDIFSHLQILKINNIQKQIQLPKSIVELIIMNHDNNLDLDLKMFQNIQKVTLENCKVDKIIGNFQLFLTNCEVNCVRTYKQRTIEQTKIKIYEQTINLKYIGVTKTNRFQTIKIKQPEYIQSVNLYGIKNIVFKNQNPYENILDFTQFINLESITLNDITCQSIIFGKSQTTIKIFCSQQREQDSVPSRIKRQQASYYYPIMMKLDKLDFSLCGNLKLAIVNNLQIKQVILQDSRIEFKNSKIKVLRFKLADIVPNISKYTMLCQYIVLQKNYQDQSIIYQQDRYMQHRQKPLILSHRIDGIYRKIQKLINE